MQKKSTEKSTDRGGSYIQTSQVAAAQIGEDLVLTLRGKRGVETGCLVGQTGRESKACGQGCGGKQ